MGQDRVEIDASQHAAQGGLGDLGGGDGVVLHLHDGLDRVGHVEQHDGVDAGRHIVLGDDLLGRDGQGDHAGVHPVHALEEGPHQVQARPVDGPQAPQAEDDAALVLGDGLQRDRHQEQQEDDDRRKGDCRGGH